MNVEILKLYNDNKVGRKLRRIDPEGYSLDEIEAMESDVNGGKEFPKAFRELLFIGGKYSAIGINMTIESKWYRGLDKVLPKRGIHLSRPYFVFNKNDEATIYSYVFLDEGDDPIVWSASLEPDYDYEGPDDEGPIQIIWNPPTQILKLSDYINYLVRRALDGLTPW